MTWLYRLQQRLAITRNESAAILVLSALLLLGLAVQHLQRQQHVEATYAEADRRFEAASARPLPTPLTAAPAPADTAGIMPPDGTLVRDEGATPAGLAGLVDINRAGAAELETLPRIGPKLAARILAYREANGPFKRVEDLAGVRGIGEKTVAGLVPLVYVGE